MSRSAARRDLPLANRIIEGLIGDWIATAANIARCCGTESEYDRGFRAGVDQMQNLGLADYHYTLTYDILDALRRAGLLREAAPE